MTTNHLPAGVSPEAFTAIVAEVLALEQRSLNFWREQHEAHGVAHLFDENSLAEAARRGSVSLIDQLIAAELRKAD